MVTLLHLQLPFSKSALLFSLMKEVEGRKVWVVPSFHSLLFIGHLVFILCTPSSKGFTNINTWVFWSVPGEVGMIASILQIRNQHWMMKCIQPGPGSVCAPNHYLLPKCLPQIVWPHFLSLEHSSIGLSTMVFVRIACVLWLLHSASFNMRPQKVAYSSHCRWEMFSAPLMKLPEHFTANAAAIVQAEHSQVSSVSACILGCCLPSSYPSSSPSSLVLYAISLRLLVALSYFSTWYSAKAEDKDKKEFIFPSSLSLSKVSGFS